MTPWPWPKTVRFSLLASAILWLALAAIFLAALSFFSARAEPILVPPPEFDRPFDGREIIERLPGAAAAAECRRRLGPAPFGRWWEACAWSFPDQLAAGRIACHVVLPDDASAARLACLRRHEDGHCGGWGKDHQGGRFC